MKRKGVRFFSVSRFFLIITFLFSFAIPNIVMAAGGPTSLVALQGQAVPGAPGFTFIFFDEPFVNTSGDETFNAGYSNVAGAFGTGVFLKRGGVLSNIALSGDVVTIGTLSESFDGPIFNNNSTVAFVNRGITSGTATAAVFQKKLSGSLSVIAKQGDAAPGTTGVFGTFDDIAQNNNDDVAFIATYTEDGGSTFKTGVFLKPSSSAMVAIVLNGDTLPGTGGGTQCGTGEGDIDGPWINDSQVVAFIADTICGGTGGFSGSLFVKRPGNSIEAFVLKGDSAPSSIGGTITDVSVGRPGLNNSNTVGFKAELSAAPGFAILTKTLGGSPNVCVLGGSAAPGTSSGTFSDFDPPAINQNGLLSIESFVTGDATVTKGIYTCQGGVVQAVALNGDPKPGTASTFGSDISDASLSDNGLVTFIDTSGPTGVFVNQLPAHTAAPTFTEWGMIILMVLAGFGSIYYLRRQRRVED